MSPLRATPRATSIDVRRARNAGDAEIADSLHAAYRERLAYLPRGARVFRGLPFALAGPTARRRWVALHRSVRLDVRGAGRASHLIVAHFCDSWHDEKGGRPDGSPIGWVEPVGQELARYTVELADGRRLERVIRRRFEINDGIVGWGMGAFAALPHVMDETLDWRGGVTPGLRDRKSVV
jgi:hypothetical protein